MNEFEPLSQVSETNRPNQENPAEPAGLRIDLSELLERDLSEKPKAGELPTVLAAMDKLANEIHYDEKTGVYTAETWLGKLETTIEELTPDHEIVVVSVDLDGFKAVNDNLGHAAGDKALRLAADILHSGFRRSSDFIGYGSETKEDVGRFGGDEFAIYVVDSGNTRRKQGALEGVMRQTEFVKTEFEKQVSGTQFDGLSFTFGIAAYEPGDTAETVHGRADMDLIQKKYKGRTDKLDELSSDELAGMNQTFEQMALAGFRVDQGLVEAVQERLAA